MVSSPLVRTGRPQGSPLHVCPFNQE